MKHFKYLIFMFVYVVICVSAFNMLIVQQDSILRKYFIDAPRARIREYNNTLANSLHKYFLKENKSSSIQELASYMRKYAKTSLFETVFYFEDEETGHFYQVGKKGLSPVKRQKLSLQKENLYPLSIDNGAIEGYLAVTLKDAGESEYTEGLQRYRMFSYSLRFLFFMLIISLVVIALYHNYSKTMRLARDMAEVKASNDGLTGLFTHAYFEKSLTIEIEKSQIYRTPLALVMLDVDHFKGYNDKYGHVAGDTVLQEVSKVIKSNTRSTDICARYGGEEFSIIIPSVQSLEEVMKPKSMRDFIAEVEGVTERIRKSVEDNKVQLDAEKVTVTISMGVAFYQKGREMINASILTEKADAALYTAKETGRNRVHFDLENVSVKV